MLRLVLIFTVLFTVIGCSPIEEKIESTYDNDQPKKVVTYQGEGDDQVAIALKEYHPNGQVQIEGSYEDGLRNGVWRAYFDDGSLQSEYTYNAGNRDGKCVVYHSTGQIYFEGQWENDQKTGVWTYFNEDGSISKPVNHSE